jgi:tetratricopeptide (TPR) repeat protein
MLAHLSLAEIFQEPETLVKVIDFCNEAFQICSDHFPQFWNDWGVALMKYSELTHDKHYLELAIEKFELAIKKQGVRLGDKLCELEWFYNYACALDFLGDFHEDAELYERSVHILSQIVAIDPKYTHARYNLALSLTHLGELVSDVDCFNKSLEHYQILLELDPEDDAAWNDCGLALLNLAQLIHDEAHPEQSLHLYEESERKLCQAVKLGSVQAFYSLACLYSVRKNYEGAVRFLEKAERAGCMPPINDLMHDEWLEELTQSQVFRHFISNLMSRQNKES